MVVSSGRASESLSPANRLADSDSKSRACPRESGASMQGALRLLNSCAQWNRSITAKGRPPSLARLGAEGRMQSSRPRQGIRPAMLSRKTSKRILRFLPWYSRLVFRAGKGWLFHLPLPPTASAHP